jgi:7,8-dihydropterin-6-yl-methyl-4-(beta-D-ribofuranosyl)aminobenzene 5'-phosphate synthase
MRVVCLVDDAVAGGRYWGEHGLSFWIESAAGVVLFDTGQSGTVLLHNLELARLDPRRIDAIVLSHAHNDHMGGLDAMLRETGRRPLYAHSDLLRERFSRHGSQIDRIGPVLGCEPLERRVDLHLSAQAQQVLPGVHTSGEISSRSEPEGRSNGHLVRDANGWSADPYRDDLSVVLQTAQGLVLVCGCCHAGLLNTLQQVHSTFGRPVHTIVGGMHLGSANEQQLQHIMEVLRGADAPRMYPNHCTGQSAYVALSNAFGERVAPCPAGTELVF